MACLRRSPRSTVNVCALLTLVMSACGGAGLTDPVEVRSAALNGISYQQKLIVPAYFDGASQSVLAGTPYQGFAIANFGSPGGPGLSRDQGDATWIGQLQTNGVVVLGYVDNPYLRLGGDITADIGNWHSWYGVNGIFFDDSQRHPSEATTTDFDVARMEYLQAYVANTFGPSAPVAFNWGQTDQLQRYVYCSQNVGGHPAPMFSTFEGTEANFQTAAFPSWVTQFQPTTFFDLLYSGMSSGAQLSIDMSRGREVANAAAIYVTDGPPANPWLHIAGYNVSPSTNMWSQEISLSALQADYPDITAMTQFECPAADLNEWSVPAVTVAVL